MIRSVDRAAARDVGDAAAHAARDVRADGAEDDGDAARHVLERVIARTFGDDLGAAVANAEALACAASHEPLTSARTVEACVSGNRFRIAADVEPAHDDATALHALADVVVRVAREIEREPVCEKRTEALPRRTMVAHVQHARLFADRALAREFVGEARADRTIGR